MTRFGRRHRLTRGKFRTFVRRHLNPLRCTMNTVRPRRCRWASPGSPSPTCTIPQRLRRSTSGSARRSQAADPAFWAEWDAYRRARRAADAARRCRTCWSGWRRTSAAFVTRLFEVERGLDALARADAALRTSCSASRSTSSASRALPLVKGGAHVASTPDDDARRRRADRGVRPRRRPRTGDRPRRLRAARSREDAERRPAAVGSRQIEALKRWCAARLHDPRVSRLGRSSASPNARLLAPRAGAAARAGAARGDARS